jgi:PAS domain S-box-containing protein
MKTHKKFNLLIISIITLLVIFLTGYQFIRSQEIKFYLKSQLLSDEQIIDKVLEFKSKGYLNPVRDNSAWDGMVYLTKSKDTLWAKENLGSVRRTFDMSFLGTFDSLGKIIFFVTDSGNVGFPIQKIQISELFAKEKIINSFFTYNNKLYEIFGAIVVPTYDIYRKTKQTGYLISSKQWDTRHISEVEKATGFGLDILPADYKNSDKEDENSEVIFRPLKDIQGKNVAQLRFSRSHQFVGELKNLKYLMIIAFIVLLLAFTIITWLTNKWIAKPLKDITHSLEDGDLSPVKYLLDRKGGFGEMARLIKRYKEQTNDLVIEVQERVKVEEKCRVIFGANLSAIAVIEADTKISVVNEAFCQISGYTKEDIIGKSWMDLVHSDDKGRMMEYRNRRVNNPTDAPEKYEFRFIRKDGAIRTGLISVALVEREDKIIASFMDITESK